MRYVGIVALAATFWISVATLRLLREKPTEPRAVSVVTSALPAARVDSDVPQLPTIEPSPVRSYEPPVIPRATRVPWPGTYVNGRTQAAFDRAMVDLGLLISSCRPKDDPPALFQVEAVVLADGRVWSANAKGKRAGSIAAQCVEEGFLSLRFSPASADVTIHHRIRLYRHHVALG